MSGIAVEYGPAERCDASFERSWAESPGFDKLDWGECKE